MTAFPHSQLPTTAFDPYQQFRDFLSSPCEVEPHLFVDTWTETTPPEGLPEPTSEEMWAADQDCVPFDGPSMVKSATPAGEIIAQAFMEVAKAQGLSVTEVTLEEAPTTYQTLVDIPVSIHPSGMDTMDMTLEMFGVEGEEAPKGRPLKKILLPGLSPSDPITLEGVEECYEMGIPEPDGRPILPPDTPEQIAAMQAPDPYWGVPLSPEQEELVRVAGIEVPEETEDLLDTLEEVIEEGHENELDYFPDTVALVEELDIPEEIPESEFPYDPASPAVILTSKMDQELSPKVESEPPYQTDISLLTAQQSSNIGWATTTSSHNPLSATLRVEGEAIFKGDVTIEGNLTLKAPDSPAQVDTVYGLPFVDGEAAPFAQDCWILDHVLKGRTFPVKTIKDLDTLRGFIETAKYALKP